MVSSSENANNSRYLLDKARKSVPKTNNGPSNEFWSDSVVKLYARD